MELYQLHYFIEIARQRSFTRAAERLRMAQPALSQQMKNLEAELRTALLVRGRKETHLTAAGQAFLPKAEKLLQDAEDAKRAVSDLLELRGGRLTMAAIPSVSACLLPEVIRAFRRLHPDVRLQVMEESSERVAELVEAGRADIGFLQLPASKSIFEHRRIITEPFVLLAPVGHTAAKQDEVALRSLAGEFFVFYKGRARDTALEACRKAGFEPRIACESGELETVRALVAAGLGLAIIPKLAASNLPKSLRAVPLREPRMQREIAAVWRKGSELSPAARVLLERWGP
ncbi:MAG: LysR family transcriptional regulator [Verrucomicrobiaceae bacterium]|nr:LysR family transcriptional regulator [Verrucomicrobiaceae bacterium]